MSIALVIVDSILNGQRSLHALDVILPVHYWQNWTHLFDSGTANLGTGALAQLVTIAVASAVAILVLLRRDPAA